jgi:hypothetical protein
MAKVKLAPISSFDITADDVMFWGRNLAPLAPKGKIKGEYHNCGQLQMETVSFRYKKDAGSIIVRPLADGSKQEIILRFKGKEYRHVFSFVGRDESIRWFMTHLEHFEVK